MSTYVRRLTLAFSAAVILHVGLAISAGTLFPGGFVERKILFQTGESSVVLELVHSVSVPSPVVPESTTGLVIEKAKPRKDESPDPVSFADSGVRSEWDGETTIRPRYPLRSRIRGEEGIVSLAVFIDARNQVRDVELVESSGFAALDQAAIEAVRKASLSGGSGVADAPLMISVRFRLVD